MTLGASLAYSIGGNCTFSGSASVDFGVNASLPDTALIVADYKEHGESSATGFGESQLKPWFQATNASASITLNAYSQPKITFGITLEKVAHVDLAVAVKLPELSAMLSVVHGS